VTLRNAYALSRTEVTVGEFRRFVQASGYRTDAERNAGGSSGCHALRLGDNKWDWRADLSWRDPGYPQGEGHPVVCVSWNDAEAYVQWLARETGKPYRLPSEAEWEWGARGRTSTSRYWGDDPAVAPCGYANGADQTPGPNGVTWPERHECRDGHFFAAPVRSFHPNAFGLHDVLGNAWEWVQDCYEADAYKGRVPADGQAIQSAACSLRVLRGGGWNFDPQRLRSANRNGISPEVRSGTSGFRLARTLP
jgi:formylglycine-generating enzyme required for sulfatase activity